MKDLTALEAAGIRVVAEREVMTLRLKQEMPGQLGALARRMADAGVNVEVLHDHRLILVVDDTERGREVAAEWDATHERRSLDHSASDHGVPAFC